MVDIDKVGFCKLICYVCMFGVLLQGFSELLVIWVVVFQLCDVVILKVFQVFWGCFFSVWWKIEWFYVRFFIV